MLRRPVLLLSLLATSAWLASCAQAPFAAAPPAVPAASALPPVVFVHGNGDSASIWLTALWRFESAGWSRDRLHAIDLPYPQSRDDDGVAQDGRSSTTDHMRFLAAEVDKVLKATGAAQVALVGNSRGGYAIRNYIANGGGDKRVSHAVLGGVPNHGVWANPARGPGNEFNGAGPFLKALNTRADGNEVTPGPKWMTIRSDRNDKYAQPDGLWIGSKGVPTNVTFDGPALKGADVNAVLPGRDHREVSFHAEAVALTATFLGAREPARPGLERQVAISLNGKVTGFTAAGPTNLPLVGASFEAYAVDGATGQRRGAALISKLIAADGHWGPLTTDSATALEFVISAPGQAITHIYRSPFARSSDIVNLRPQRLVVADKDAAAVLIMMRPRGYFGLGRDRISFDGEAAPKDISIGVPGVDTTRLRLTDNTDRPVVGEFNGERIVARAWSAADNHISVLELHY